MEILIIILIAAAGIVAVGYPIVRGERPARPRTAAGPVLTDNASIEAEVGRYRTAIRAGTLCPRCRFANPAGSSFCADCGKRLPTAHQSDRSN